MSKYHTQGLKNADIFTIMGSIYAEVARYDSALEAHQPAVAEQAVARAEEIMAFAQNLSQINEAQKMELKTFSDVFSHKVDKLSKSGLDDYLLPFALAARLRQFS